MCASQLTFKVERKTQRNVIKCIIELPFDSREFHACFLVIFCVCSYLSASWNWLASNFILWNKDRQLEEWLLLRMNVLERRVMLTMLRWLIWIFDCVTIWRKLLRDAHKWRPHIHWNRIGCWLNTEKPWPRSFDLISPASLASLIGLLWSRLSDFIQINRRMSSKQKLETIKKLDSQYFSKNHTSFP